jgi:hypothetical protein
MLPILLAEKCSAPEAIKRSAALISAKWGVARRVSIKGSTMILWTRIASFLPAFIALLIGGKTILIVGSIITAVLFLSVSSINAAALIMAISALYLCAIDVNTSPYYDADALKSAFYSPPLKREQ